jgi:hypothetical protein
LRFPCPICGRKTRRRVHIREYLTRNRSTATGCTHRARVPPLGRATVPPGSAVPTSCAFRRFSRHHLRARITPRAPRRREPPHLSSLSSPTPLRSTGSSAISLRSAVPRRGSYARHRTEIHPQLPCRLLSLEPHRQGLLPTIASRLLVHFFPPLTLQDLAIPVPVPVPITKESSVPQFGPPCSRALTLTQRVLRIRIAISWTTAAVPPRSSTGAQCGRRGRPRLSRQAAVRAWRGETG